MNSHKIHVKLSVYINLHSSALILKILLFIPAIFFFSCSFCPFLLEFSPEIFLSFLVVMFLKCCYCLLTITVEFLSLCKIECDTNAKRNP